MDNETDTDLSVATFGTGCFWCTEAVFQTMQEVHKVVSGYSGGQRKDPTYEQVCSSATGHAECVQITYNPNEVSYAGLLEAFFRSHDPTSLNRQGNDVGTQYRSVIFYNNEGQHQLAEEAVRELDKSGAYPQPIVTEILPAEPFYPAEAYHQNYYINNPSQGYCAFVVAPKVEKFKKVFKEKLKPQFV